MITLSVCIPSIGRPSLVRCIESIWASDITDLDVSVFVADDSTNGQIERTLAEKPTGLRTPTIVPSGAWNISAARNALLNAAKGDLLLFLDDDEWIERDTIQRLVVTLQQHRAAAVFGGVVSHYPDDAPQWSKEVRPYDRRVAATGTKVPTGATSLVLIDRQALHRHEVRFDLDMGKTGGEDTAFFGELHRRGEKLVTCAEANAHELVPIERLAPRYVLARYERGGQSFAQSTLEGRSAKAKGVAALRILAKAAAATGGDLLTRPLSRDRNMRWRIKAAGQYGQLRHLLGRPLKTLY